MNSDRLVEPRIRSETRQEFRSATSEASVAELAKSFGPPTSATESLDDFRYAEDGSQGQHKWQVHASPLATG